MLDGSLWIQGKKCVASLSWCLWRDHEDGDKKKWQLKFVEASFLVSLINLYSEPKKRKKQLKDAKLCLRKCRAVVSEIYFEHDSNVWHSRETCLLSFRLTAADVFLSAIQSVILLLSLFLVESPTGVGKDVMMHPLQIWQEKKRKKNSSMCRSLNFLWISCSACNSAIYSLFSFYHHIIALYLD